MWPASVTPKGTPKGSPHPNTPMENEQTADTLTPDDRMVMEMMADMIGLRTLDFIEDEFGTNVPHPVLALMFAKGFVTVVTSMIKKGEFIGTKEHAVNVSVDMIRGLLESNVEKHTTTTTDGNA